MKIDGEEIEVRQLRDDWALSLMEQGVIVRLTISRWRATSRLKYEELGLSFFDADHQDFMRNYIDLGHEKLLPPDVLREITAVETKARRILSAYSYNTLWGRFVPYSSFSIWRQDNEIVQDEFMSLAKDLGNKYDDIIVEVRRDYERMGREVWNRLYQGTEPTISFLDNFTSRIIDKIPSREEIVCSFKYEAIFLNIPLPSFVQEDIAKAQQIAIDTEKNFIQSRIDIETKQQIAEEYREKKKELVDSFLDSTVSFFRHHIAELADHTYQILQKNESEVNMMHVKKIKSMVSKVRNLNFHDDKEIATILNDLEEEVDKYKGERDKVVIQNRLQELVDLSKKEYLPEGFNPIVDFIEIK